MTEEIEEKKYAKLRYVNGKQHIRLERLDAHYLFLAEKASLESRDPSTKVGALMLTTDKKEYTGYNKIPTLFITEKNYAIREKKYQRIIHAEVRAVLKTIEEKGLKPTTFDQGETLYVYPFLPCAECAKFLIELRISRIATIQPTEEHLTRWKDSFYLSRQLFKEAGTKVVVYEREQYEAFRDKFIKELGCDSSGKSSLPWNT